MLGGAPLGQEAGWCTFGAGGRAFEGTTRTTRLQERFRLMNVVALDEFLSIYLKEPWVVPTFLKATF